MINMHGYGRSKYLLSQAYIYVVECIANVTGTYYCPEYYPPPLQCLYNWSGQLNICNQMCGGQ